MSAQDDLRRAAYARRKRVNILALALSKLLLAQLKKSEGAKS